MKPVLYLDVDGVLWVLRPENERKNSLQPAKWSMGAPGLRRFLDWVLENMEVRWCTTWAISGTMSADQMHRLSEHTSIPVEDWAKVQPGKGWEDSKCENITWEEHLNGRPFAWVEDGLVPRELNQLNELGFLDCYIYTDVFKDPDALIKALKELKRRFSPGEKI